MAYDEETAQRVRKVLSGRRDVVERKMMGGVCFMVQGGMCCTVSGRGGMLIRIRPETQAETLREPHVQPMEMGARVMTGFVRLAPEGYRTDAALGKWVRRGLDAAAARPAKPSRPRPRRAKRRKSPARSKRRAKKR
ncbi:MAG TPA: TfoX/Sxy family protein [Stellaceae bacterium]|nr:TfoX/Sxy family protein [Stellaceae bacterium]